MLDPRIPGHQQHWQETESTITGLVRFATPERFFSSCTCVLLSDCSVWARNSLTVAAETPPRYYPCAISPRPCAICNRPTIQVRKAFLRFRQVRSLHDLRVINLVKQVCHKSASQQREEGETEFLPTVYSHAYHVIPQWMSWE